VKDYSVYIKASVTRVLYAGVTGDLARRVIEQRESRVPEFTARCNVNRWFERYADVRVALAREGQIKGWTRGKKIALIESANPGWDDPGETLAQAQQNPSRSLRMTLSSDAVDGAMSVMGARMNASAERL
jgi:putative endonuclease